MATMSKGSRDGVGSIDSKRTDRYESPRIDASDDEEEEVVVNLIVPPRVKAQLQSSEFLERDNDDFGNDLRAIVGRAKKQLEEHAKAVRQSESIDCRLMADEEQSRGSCAKDQRDPSCDESAKRDLEVEEEAPSITYANAEKAFLSIFAASRKSAGSPRLHGLLSDLPHQTQNNSPKLRTIAPDALSPVKRRGIDSLSEKFLETNQGPDVDHQHTTSTCIVERRSLPVMIPGALSIQDCKSDEDERLISGPHMRMTNSVGGQKSSITGTSISGGDAPPHGSAVKQVPESSDLTRSPAIEAPSHATDVGETNDHVLENDLPGGKSPTYKIPQVTVVDYRSLEQVEVFGRIEREQMTNVVSPRACSISSNRSGKLHAATSGESVAGSKHGSCVDQQISVAGNKQTSVGPPDAKSVASVLSFPDSTKQKMRNLLQADEKLNDLAKSSSFVRNSFSVKERSPRPQNELDASTLSNLTGYQKNPYIDDRFSDIRPTDLVVSVPSPCRSPREKSMTDFYKNIADELPSSLSAVHTLSPQFEFSGQTLSECYSRDTFRSQTSRLKCYSKNGESYDELASTCKSERKSTISRSRRGGDGAKTVIGDKETIQTDLDLSIMSPPVIVKMAKPAPVVGRVSAEDDNQDTDEQSKMLSVTPKGSKISKLARLVTGRKATPRKEAESDEIRKGNVAKLKEIYASRENGIPPPNVNVPGPSKLDNQAGTSGNNPGGEDGRYRKVSSPGTGTSSKWQRDGDRVNVLDGGGADQIEVVPKLSDAPLKQKLAGVRKDEAVSVIAQENNGSLMEREKPSSDGMDDSKRTAINTPDVADQQMKVPTTLNDMRNSGSGNYSASLINDGSKPRLQATASNAEFISELTGKTTSEKEFPSLAAEDAVSSAKKKKKRNLGIVKRFFSMKGPFRRNGGNQYSLDADLAQFPSRDSEETGLTRGTQFERFGKAETVNELVGMSFETLNNFSHLSPRTKECIQEAHGSVRASAQGDKKSEPNPVTDSGISPNGSLCSSTLLSPQHSMLTYRAKLCLDEIQNQRTCDDGGASVATFLSTTSLPQDSRTIKVTPKISSALNSIENAMARVGNEIELKGNSLKKASVPLSPVSEGVVGTIGVAATKMSNREGNTGLEAHTNRMDSKMTSDNPSAVPEMDHSNKDTVRQDSSGKAVLNEARKKRKEEKSKVDITALSEKERQSPHSHKHSAKGDLAVNSSVESKNEPQKLELLSTKDTQKKIKDKSSKDTQRESAESKKEKKSTRGRSVAKKEQILQSKKSSTADENALLHQGNQVGVSSKDNESAKLEESPCKTPNQEKIDEETIKGNNRSASLPKSGEIQSTEKSAALKKNEASGVKKRKEKLANASERKHDGASRQSIPESHDATNDSSTNTLKEKERNRSKSSASSSRKESRDPPEVGFGVDGAGKYVLGNDDSSVKILGRIDDPKDHDSSSRLDEGSDVSASKKVMTKKKDGFFGFKIRKDSRERNKGESDSGNEAHTSVPLEDKDEALSLSEFSIQQKMRVMATSDEEIVSGDEAENENEDEDTNKLLKKLLFTPRAKLCVEQVERDAGIKNEELHSRTSNLKKIQLSKSKSPKKSSGKNQSKGPPNKNREFFKDDVSHISATIPRVISHISRARLEDDDVSDATSPSYTNKSPSSKKAKDGRRTKKSNFKYTIHDDGVSVQASNASKMSKVSGRTGMTKKSLLKTRSRDTHEKGKKSSLQNKSRDAHEETSHSASKMMQPKKKIDELSLTHSLGSFPFSDDEDISDPYASRDAQWGWNVGNGWLW